MGRVEQPPAPAYLYEKHICDTLAERWEMVITVIDAE